MAREIPGGEVAYLRTLPLNDAIKIAGSRARLQQLFNGAKFDDVVNAGRDGMYRLERMGAAGGQAQATTHINPLRPWQKTITTTETDWHDASFVDSPQWVKDAVAKRGVLAGGVNSTLPLGQAHFNKLPDLIDMGKFARSDPLAQVVWRHEYGHAIDAAKATKYTYRSSDADFFGAMFSDAGALIDKGAHGDAFLPHTQTQRAILNAAYGDSKIAFQGAGDATARSKWLESRFKASGFDFAEFQAAMVDHADFATNLHGIGLQDRYRRIIVAIEQKDAQGMMDAMTGGMDIKYKLERDATFEKGSIGNLSDLFGSATENKVAGANKSGFGHIDSYYATHGMSGTESFANMTALFGDKHQTLGQIVDHFTPEMAKLFKEILKK